MWRVFAVIRPTLHNFTNTHRIADESMFTTTDQFPTYAAAANNRRTFSTAIFNIIRAPFSILSCFAPPSVHRSPDAFWLSGDHYFASTISEINHLMVSDGMRYAILM
ncbi:uncharacterized protein E5676_scaffold177G00520 [Cucumis melo var. makuwa]|uniref:Uncharacterized protein n=2 Tax=Cucumis melo TaxID=3656 RepID=A0A5D3CJA9_CUCMM|nr:uncharacterized protein E5676_scaffold177G00520 [Cucumis melo var. makuwa]